MADQPVTRARSRVQPVADGNAKQSTDTSGSWLTRGRAGVTKAEEVQKDREERRNAPRMPFDFSIKKGGEREIIILEASIDDCPFVWEHEVWGEGEGSQKQLVTCVKEFGNCALCERAEGGKSKRFKPSYYAMKVTCLDLSGYEKDGKHVDQAMRRMMTIKSGQTNDFIRLHDACVKMHQTMRGMYLILHRDNTDTSPRIGKPIIQENGSMFQMYSEQQLVSEFGHPAVMSTKEPNKVAVEANGYLEPFDWGKIYPKPDVEDVRRRFGNGQAQAGSKAEADREWGEGEGEASTQVRRRAPAQSSAPPAEDTAEQPAAPVRERQRPGAAAPEKTAAPAVEKPPQGGTRTGVVRRGGRTGGTTIAQELDDNIPY